MSGSIQINHKQVEVDDISFSEIMKLRQQLKDCREWMRQIIVSEDLLDCGWKAEFQERGEQLLKGGKL